MVLRVKDFATDPPYGQFHGFWPAVLYMLAPEWFHDDWDFFEISPNKSSDLVWILLCRLLSTNVSLLQDLKSPFTKR